MIYYQCLSIYIVGLDKEESQSKRKHRKHPTVKLKEVGARMSWNRLSRTYVVTQVTIVRW